MIAKLLRAVKFGIFKNFTWDQALHDFKKKNLLYAYNGGGKTTLSTIFRLFSTLESEEQKNVLFDEFSTGNDAIVEMEINEEQVSFNATEGSEKVYVFNCDFITDHIYEGTTAKMKRFDSTVNSNIKDKEISDLEKNRNEKQKALLKTEAELTKLNERFEEIKRQVSSAFGKRISNKRLTGVEIQRLPATAKTDAALESEIDTKVKSYHVSLQLDQLKQDIVSLKQLSIEKVEVKDQQITELLSKSLSTSVGNLLKVKIAKLKSYNNDVADGIELWYQNAEQLLKVAAAEKPSHCPVCDSDITTIASQLIDEYQKYFDREYDAFLGKLTSAITHVGSLMHKVTTNSDFISTLRELLSKYSDKDYSKINFQAAAIIGKFEALQSLFEIKKSDMTTDVAGDFDGVAFRNTLDDYNSFLNTFMQARNELIQNLEKQNYDPKKLEAEIKDAHKQIALVQFDEPGKKNNIDKHFSLTAEVTKLSSEISMIEVSLSKARAKLKSEAKYVNRLLKELGIHHFTIDIHETKPSENIEIIYESGTRKSRLRHSISDGEKTALCFAYFLSKIQYEITDTADGKVEDCVIVLDDPITSLDENRLYSTACLIHNRFEHAKQLFVFSHNLVFMKFLGNILGHHDRSDYFLSIYRGGIALENLPKGLTNYTTIYFQKLEDITKFVEGHLDYEEAKKFVPNNIRVVLEAFLSFKFCALKNGSSGDGKRVAGLDKLINQVGLNISVYKAFPKAGNIDASNILDRLRKIQRITDPQAHGSPESIHDFNFISEIELMELAQDTLDTVRFLDNVHYTSAHAN